MSEPTDDDLMLRIQQGNQIACRTLIEQHLPALQRFATRLLGSSMDVDDVLQETFFRVWTRAEQWQPGRARLTTWIHRILHNVCIDNLRKQRIQPGEPLTEDHDSGQNPESDHEMSTQAKRVIDALQSLPERQKTAIILCHYQGFSNRETAEILCVTLAALESLMARGRRTLRKQLIGEDE